MSGSAGTRALIAALVAAAALLALPAVSGAATITVAATGDDPLAAPNGICTLREAIHEANANTDGLTADCDFNETTPFGDDTITLNAGTYGLDESTGSADDDNVAGDLDVETDPLSGSLTIDGAGATSTTIETAFGWAERVLHQTNFISAATLTVSDLTITGGNTLGDGGGINSDSGTLAVQRTRVDFSAATGNGGGIFSDSDSVALSIVDSEISNNDATVTGGGISAQPTSSVTIDSSRVFGNDVIGAGATNGGGASINSLGSLIVTNSIIQGNGVEDSNSSADGGGLAIFNATATIRNSEISQNELTAFTNLVESQGVGIRTGGTTDLDLVNSTVSGNFFTGTGDFSGGALNASGASVEIAHSSFADNEQGAGGVLIRSSGTLMVRGSAVETMDPACAGTVSSGGYNVFPDASCGAPATGDEQNADPMLGTLQDNGGPDVGAPSLLAPVRSHAPANNSTAVDHVPQANCIDLPSGFLTQDQRLLPRPEDFDADGAAECDAGSVELQLPEPPPPPPPPAPTGKCAGKKATIVGTSAGEVLRGTGKRDIVAAKAGKDTVKGLGGNDLICGGDGNDRLVGAKGKDTLRGDAGRDTLLGGAKKDTLKGGKGRDVCKGGAKRDRASGCEIRRRI